ncbi:L,D-transpeptidase family protein [Roseburia hominis]
MIDKKMTMDNSDADQEVDERTVSGEVEEISENKEKERTTEEAAADDNAVGASGSDISGDDVDSVAAGSGDRDVERENESEQMVEEKIEEQKEPKAKKHKNNKDKEKDDRILDERAAEAEKEESQKLKEDMEQFLAEEKEEGRRKRRAKVRRRRKADPDEEPVLSADDGEEIEPELSAGEGEDLEPELSADDGEELDEEPLTEEEKAERRRKWKKAAKIVVGSIFGLAAAIYLGFAAFFMSHFYFNTTINGTDFALKSVDDVEAFMKSQVDSYVLTLKKSDGTQEVIDGSDIAVAYKKSDELSKQLKAQNPFLWPKGLWEESEITASVGVEYDGQKLTEKLASLDCMKEENQTPPVSSKPEFDGNQFVPKKEETGSQIDQEIFREKVGEYIEGFQNQMDMTEESCYVKPKYLQDSEEVKKACDTMNQYLKASITYTMGSNNEVVDKAVISQWVNTDDNMAVTFNSDKVTEYVAELAKKYNTRGTQRTFVSGNGNTVKVEGGDYGWIIDKEAESKALLENIQKGDVVSREPAYKQKAASHDGADWGGTYVEVDLTNQNVYLFVNGSLVINAPIVTGKPSAGDATPQGVYLIKYCTRNATLRGPKKPDGSYEWESPVSFWMPFNGGIGLHDAPWQAAFGGSRYLTHGSHGCVNLQYNVAKTIYNNVQAGTPVVCHY